MQLSFYYEIPEYQLNNSSIVEKLIIELVRKESKILGEISYYFVSDNSIELINRKYLNHNYPTDIITFNNCFLDTVSGDIYISMDSVKSNAAIHEDGNVVRELYRNIIHGVLHLIGYDDKYPADKLVMRKKEDFYLNYLDNF